MKISATTYGYIALGVVLLGWAGIPAALLFKYGAPDSASDMATVLGVAGGLFTGLAFAGLLYTVALQRKALGLQGLELRLTRKELHLLAESQTAAAQSLASQLQEMETSRQLSAAMDMFNELNSEASMATRRHIYSLSVPIEAMQDDKRLQEVEQLLNQLNLVGYLLAKEFLPKHPTLELFYITVSRIWAKLGDYIIETRVARGVYLHHFQWLVQQSLDYWRDRHQSHTIAINNPSTGQSVLVDREAIQQKLHDLASSTAHYIAPDATG